MMTDKRESSQSAITATANNDNGVVKHTMCLFDPKLTSANWFRIKTTTNTASELEVCKYGKKMVLQVVTEASYNCKLVVCVSCDDWKAEYQNQIFESYINTPGNFDPVSTLSVFEFKPNVNWLKDDLDVEESEIVATTCLYKSFSAYSRIDNVKSELLLYLKDNDSSKLKSLGIEIYGKPLEVKRKLRKIIIVIDPGHGVIGGNVGTQAKEYMYAKESDGKKMIDENGNVVPFDENYHKVSNLPDYFLNNPDEFFIAEKYDNEFTESMFVYDISIDIVTALKARNYTVYNTREKREPISLKADQKHALGYRVDIANNKNADYFVSLHADGNVVINMRGAHAIFYSGDKGSKVFASYLLDDSVIPKLPKHPSGRTDLRVLKPSNKAKYKTLIEFGFMSNPMDAQLMFTKKEEFATKLVKGLIKHIEEKFEL